MKIAVITLTVLLNVLPPLVCILSFFPSQETPVEAVVKVAQVSSMFGYIQVRRVSTILYFAYYYQCNSFMVDAHKESPNPAVVATADVGVGMPVHLCVYS